MGEMKTNADRDLIGVAVDNVVFNLSTKAVTVLLIKRGNPPFQHQWALPGGFVDYKDESLADAATRELVEETRLVVPASHLRQVHTTDSLKRDPRGPIVTVVYSVIGHFGEVVGSDDAVDARWWSIYHLDQPLDDQGLAFDHRKLIEIAQSYEHWQPMYRRHIEDRT